MIVLAFMKLCLMIVLGALKVVGVILGGIGIGISSILKNGADKNNN